MLFQWLEYWEIILIFNIKLFSKLVESLGKKKATSTPLQAKEVGVPFNEMLLSKTA